MCRLSRTIPTEVTDFLKHIKHRTGAVFIALAAYTNEDGEQTYARFDHNFHSDVSAFMSFQI